jgi:phosphoenolpyruvate carboxylase
MGAALHAYVEEGCDESPATATERLDQLRDMAQSWPFFKGLLSNMEQVLAKTDLGIGKRYASLVPNKRQREAIFGRIEAEFHLTLDLLQQVTGRSLLENDPQLQEALSERFAYIDPLNHLQVELLRRHRKALKEARNHDDAESSGQRAIHLTINGIAAGLRNSG